MQGDIEIIPLFPSSLCSIILPEMMSNFWEKELPNIKFYTIGDSPTWHTERTVLENYLEIKEVFLVAAKDCFNELGYDQKIKITTSWLTAIKPEDSSMWHRHTNSWYSCVYYFQDSCSDLMINNDKRRDIDVIATKSTIHSDLICRISPQKNQFIMFPSYLQHQITKNTSKEVRHSLAFNIMPSGTVGFADSMMDYGE